MKDSTLLEKLKHLLITALLSLISFLSSNMTKKTRIVFGKIVGQFLMLISSKRKQVTYDNINMAFPDKSESDKQFILQGAYFNLGITMLEIMAMRRINKNNLSDYIIYENPELLNEISSRNKGMILMSGHYGNWELLAYSSGLISDSKVNVIVLKQKNSYSNKILNKIRTAAGNNIIFADNSARSIINVLKNHESIAIIADQSATEDKDVYIKFMGEYAPTYEAPANLALKFNAPIVMGFAERQDDGRYHVKLEEIKMDDLEFNKEGVLELTKRHVKALEDQIIKRPELWAWQHKRWKHKDKYYNSIQNKQSN